MKKGIVVSIILITIVILALIVETNHDNPDGSNGEADAFVGIAYCGNSVEGAKLFIDMVKDYTNLFVLQSGSLQRDLKSVDEIGDYAISAGMYFLPYFGSYLHTAFYPWFENATQRWGVHLLGIYYDDEIGGKMLDDYVEFEEEATSNSIIKTRYGDVVVEQPDGIVVHYEIGGIVHFYQPANRTQNEGTFGKAINATENTEIYSTFYPNGTITAESTSNDELTNWKPLITYRQLMDLRPFKNPNEVTEKFIAHYRNNVNSLSSYSTTVFTSDYALYWFDYLSGYDILLAQIGWNITDTQQIALIRGAAELQGKDWGTFLTWKYDVPPFLASGPEIFEQMKTAYKCGAKYIVIFNYYENQDEIYGTMKDEHFAAMETFWKEVINNPEVERGSIQSDSVLVLPQNYGSGMRWPEDKVWGIFRADADTSLIWKSIQDCLEKHGLKLDIVYEDSEFPLGGKYQNILYWNQMG